MSTDPTSEVRRARRERRQHIRHSAASLPSIRGSRLRHGPPVSLIDLSVGGALVETAMQMKPGTSLALELAGDTLSLVRMRVLRCGVPPVRAEATIYRGACEFVRPLELPGLVAEPIAPVPAARPFIGLDASLKLLADRCRSGAAGGPLAMPEVLRILRTLEGRARELDADQLAEPIR